MQPLALQCSRHFDLGTQGHLTCRNNAFQATCCQALEVLKNLRGNLQKLEEGELSKATM